MDPERFYFLKSDNPAYNLSPDAMSRIVARGLGQNLRSSHSHCPLLTLVNSEAHILCSDVDTTATKLAFGQWALPKLRRELLSVEPLVSKRALMSLLDLVCDPEKAVEAIRLQFVPRLVRLMLSEEAFTRQRVLMILEVLAMQMQPSGKEAIMKNKFIISNLLMLLSDPDSSVRISAAKAVFSLANLYLCVEEMISQYFISVIINRLEIEMETDIMILLLDTLVLLLNNDTAKKIALDNSGVELLVLLEHPLVEVRASAGAVLAQLAQHPQGKEAMLNHRTDILLTLTRLLQDEEVTVRTQAAEILMFILTGTKARKHVLKFPTMELLIHNAEVGQHNFALQVNSIKALTLIAECRDGRTFLKGTLERLQNIKPYNKLTQQHKDTLLSVVTRVV